MNFRRYQVFTVLLFAFAGTPVAAQDQSPAAGRGATNEKPAATIEGKQIAPVEIVTGLKDNVPSCEPSELRIPAGQPIDLRIVNRSDQQFTLAGPIIFADQNLIRFEGDVVHSAGNAGYIVKASGTARIILRTPPAGDYEFTCANTRNQGTPFRGKMTVVAG